ncbi:Hypothetical protein LUCI_2529 [Lucifera butyrica]|uniref:Uncharacterized protein n=1 Tax=Lucifera butyrica TaxID=1351585 RepID=A0A498R8I4_9FIRM|nr:hypothetical protein [Lucifera butyrica]VBB07285.1 Hypothetical protein LUCI_2529 [Lucifera butyrica]
MYGTTKKDTGAGISPQKAIPAASTKHKKHLENILTITARKDNLFWDKTNFLPGETN